MTHQDYLRLSDQLRSLSLRAASLRREVMENKYGKSIPHRITRYTVRSYRVRTHQRVRLTLWPKT